MTELDQGPRIKTRQLPSPENIAREVYAVGVENTVDPEKVIIFGSYADGGNTNSSDCDVVVVADFDEEDLHARSYHWDWDWDYDQYPELDLIPVTPDEFNDYSDREHHIVSTAVETGVSFEF